jgi:hypothetical protein
MARLLSSVGWAKVVHSGVPECTRNQEGGTSPTMATIVGEEAYAWCPSGDYQFFCVSAGVGTQSGYSRVAGTCAGASLGGLNPAAPSAALVMNPPPRNETVAKDEVSTWPRWVGPFRTLRAALSDRGFRTTFRSRASPICRPEASHGRDWPLRNHALPLPQSKVHRHVVAQALFQPLAPALSLSDNA